MITNRNKTVITHLPIVILLFLLSINCFSQCKSEFVDNLLQFSKRMAKPFYPDKYQQYYDRWEHRAMPAININNFIENDITIEYQNYIHIADMSSTDSLDLCYSMLHNDSIEMKVNCMTRIFAQKKDTLPSLISSFLVKDKSYWVRQHCAVLLKFYSLNDAFNSLKVLTDDPCVFVRLEAALSLSYIGEKAVSYNTFINIWNMNDPRINTNQFQYFTEGMRNIGDQNSIGVLTSLLSNKNPYCVTDASICLLQMKRKEDCINGLRTILKLNNVGLFYTSSMVLFKYFPSGVVRLELEPYLQSPDKNIAGFSNFIINHVLTESK